MMRYFLAVFAIFIAANAFASEEGVLVFSNFSFESEGIGNSGPVKIIGVREAGKDSNLEIKINAFSREYVVPAELLKKLRYGEFNGVRLSYEPGYKDVGGRVIYIVLEFGFTSVLRDQLMIAMQEDGSSYAETLQIHSSSKK